MFPSLALRETFVAETNLLFENKKCFRLKQKQFCFPDTTFASATYIYKATMNYNADYLPVPLAY